MPKKEGGLGVKDVTSFNISLLGKWKWDLFQNQGETWARVLDLKYGGWRSLDGDHKGSTESLWWRDLKMVNQHTLQGQQLNRSISWKVGCGDKFKFWKDRWIGGGSQLSVKYRRLYTISAQKHHLIQQLGAFKEEGWEWHFQWRRSLFDSEIELAVAFIQEIEGITISPDLNDQWRWAAEPNGSYSRESVLGEGQDGGYKELWKLRVPSKVAIFAWRLLKDRLPTRGNLKKKRVELQEYLCPFCRSAEESASHLFFQCSKIIPLWWEAASWVNLAGVFPHQPRHHFIQHFYGVYDGVHAHRWQSWWLALTYTIWKHRNSIIFSNAVFNAHNIMDETVFLLWTWLRNLEKNFTSHFNQWSSNIKDGFLRTPT